jgi:hypothetical protein
MESDIDSQDKTIDKQAKGWLSLALGLGFVLVITGTFMAGKRVLNACYDPISHNASGGGEHGLSLWHFHASDDSLLFVLGHKECSAKSGMTLLPGLQGWVAHDLLIPEFDLRFQGKTFRVKYSKRGNSLEIGECTYDLDHGRVFIFRPTPPATTILQIDIQQDPKQFGIYQGSKLLDAVGKRMSDIEEAGRFETREGECAAAGRRR